MIDFIPLASCKSAVVMYAGKLRIEQSAWFWSTCIFSMWHSAALTTQTLPYSNIGRIIDLYNLTSSVGFDFLDKPDEIQSGVSFSNHLGSLRLPSEI